MRLHVRFSAILGAAWCAIPACLGTAPAAAAVPAVLQVKGSDTIGGKLGQDLAHAYMAGHPETEVKWEALGSGTAFVGLLDGSAQLGAASRAVKEGELADARKLGIELREFVIGYDGIAVVVNPANPVAELTVTQLSDVFTGKIRDWSEVGGPSLPIHLVSRPSYSGTFSFFRDKVLRHGNDKGPEDYAATAEIIEENGAIIQRVAQDRGAVSYVGIGWVTPAVKTVGVAAQAGRPAVRASVATVRTGTYPIYRPLLMYSRGEPHGPARELLAFILSAAGQAVVAKNDFVPTDSPATLAAEAPAARVTPGSPRGEPAGEAAAQGGAGGARSTRSVQANDQPQVTRVRFPKGTALTADAKSSLASLADVVKASGNRLLVVGHADTRGAKAVNLRVSRARAAAVADYLVELGVPRSAMTVEAHGADDPVASNQQAAGRGSNRRVDVTVLAPPAQPAKAARQ